MALLTVQHTSAVLGKAMETLILLPGDSKPPPVHGFPTVWLFHGRGESAETWLRHPHLGDLAARHGCALVMPTVANTRYADALEGDQNWTYVSEELPNYLERRLPLARNPEQRFAAGFSIGGLCALKLGEETDGDHDRDYVEQELESVFGFLMDGTD
jgi:S-formylglutathione hydrolase FrmB